MDAENEYDTIPGSPVGKNFQAQHIYIAVNIPDINLKVNPFSIAF